MSLGGFPYQELYNSIKKDKPHWLTISPPRRDGLPNTLFKRDKDLFLCNIKKFASQFICVAEIANDRLHYHIFYSLSNRIYRFKFLGGIAETLRYQYKDYKGEPKEGLEWIDEENKKRQPIEYLYKDVEETKDYGIKQPILTQEDFKKEKKLKVLPTFAHEDIPAWMLPDTT